MPNGHAMPAPSAAAVPVGDTPRGGLFAVTRKPWWPMARRIVSIGFLLFVGSLVAWQATQIEWAEVGVALRKQPIDGLLTAFALAALSFTLYSSFDLFGRNYTGHKLAAPTVMGIAAISYAFNLSLGALIGGIGFRYKLYTKNGLLPGAIAKIISLSMLTNWLGYLFAAGMVFLIHPLSLPAGWSIDSQTLRFMGGTLAVLALAYVAFVMLARQREWTVRHYVLKLPARGTAPLQLLVATLNWMVIASVVYVLLQQRIDYLTVLAVLLLGAIAGILARVPAGLGVLEAVFVALLSDQLPRNELLAAVLAYRAVYYLGPLAIAALSHLTIEALSKRRDAADA